MTVTITQIATELTVDWKLPTTPDAQTSLRRRIERQIKADGIKATKSVEGTKAKTYPENTVDRLTKNETFKNYLLKHATDPDFVKAKEAESFHDDFIANYFQDFTSLKERLDAIYDHKLERIQVSIIFEKLTTGATGKPKIDETKLMDDIMTATTSPAQTPQGFEAFQKARSDLNDPKNYYTI